MTVRHSRLALTLGAFALTLTAAACDQEMDKPMSNADDSDRVSYVGFALTDDDAADDDFTAEDDPSALLAEFEDAFNEDRPPNANEVDPIPAGDEAPMERPDLISRVVLVTWGQPTFNPDVENPTVWRGKISSGVARVRVLRKFRFDGANDDLARDGDPSTVSFSTVTRPHNDGLLLRITAPRNLETMGGRLTFDTEHFRQSVSLGDVLMGFQHSFEADDQGNVLHITSVAPSECPHGALRMRWKRIDNRGGIFGGKVFGPQGEHAGFVVGVWGALGDKRRFKGFYLNADRSYKGTLKGTWAKSDVQGFDGGTFRGVWVNRAQTVHGVLGGAYHASDAGRFGTARGVWRARCRADIDNDNGRCDGDLALPAPARVDCDCERDDLPGSCACASAPEFSGTCAPRLDDLPEAE